MLINNTHIADALGLTWRDLRNVTPMIHKYVKTVSLVPKNNKCIKYAAVKHFDLDEAIEVFKGLKPTRARTNILNMLREVKQSL